MREGNGMRTDEALGVQANSITAVGDSAAAESATEGARVLDFGTRTIMPGFIDTHTHAAWGSIGTQTMINCVDDCDAIDDMLQRLSDNLDDRGESGWLIGRGLLFLNRRWKDGRYPTREDLDRVSRDVPIAVQTGHLTIMNSRGLGVSDIRRFIGVQHGSNGPVTVQLGADGEPNGLVNNMDSLLPLPEADEALAKSAIDQGVRRLYTANGVTSLCEMSDTRVSLRALTELVDEQRVGTRFTLFLMVPATMTLEEAVNWWEIGIVERSGLMDVKGVKIFADGGYSSSDAAVHVPYCDHAALSPGSRGRLTFEETELADLVRTVADANLQLAVHTNGERAQEQICRVVADLALDGSQPVRLEHGANWMWDPQTPAQWRRAGAIPVPQPMFIYTMAAGMPYYLGDYGAAHGRSPYKSLMADGWRLAAGSDWFWGFEEKVTNPFFSMWCCMKREGWDGVVIDPEEALDLESALRMHTINGASLLGVDRSRGTLERGKLADIVVLDRDITTGVDAENVRDVKVDHVYMDGRLVFSRDGAEPAVVRDRG